MTLLLFFLFAALAIGGGFLTVTRRNPVASLLSLVLTFFSLAAIYVLLEAHFIAVIQVIVYAGAIMVLFLFVIMLLNLGHDYKSDLREMVWIASGFGVSGVIGYFLYRAFAGEGEALALAATGLAEKATTGTNAVDAIAQPLFRDFLVPFELTSILLLVAVIGAVLLAKRRV